MADDSIPSSVLVKLTKPHYESEWLAIVRPSAAEPLLGATLLWLRHLDVNLGHGQIVKSSSFIGTVTLYCEITYRSMANALSVPRQPFPSDADSLWFRNVLMNLAANSPSPEG